MIVGNTDSTMTLLKAYLTTPRAQKVLASKPFEQGFSLIELVVVVAVLAILSAIAIPSFTSINDKARSSAAANTVATVAKECAVKYANGEASPTFAAVTLDGYTSFNSSTGGSTSATACTKTGTIVATATTVTDLPHFTYNTSTGAKTCQFGNADSSAADGLKVGCKGLTAGTPGNGVW
jgi:type IV pilus assembly protein PilA